MVSNCCTRVAHKSVLLRSIWLGSLMVCAFKINQDTLSHKGAWVSYSSNLYFEGRGRRIIDQLDIHSKDQTSQGYIDSVTKQTEMTNNKTTCLDTSQIQEYSLFLSSIEIVLQLSAICVLIRYDIKILKGKMGNHSFF